MSSATPNATGFVVNACSLVSSVLILYDYLLTVSREVEYVWRSRTTASVAVFYCSRYAALAYGVFGICQILSWSDYASCIAMNVIPQILMMTILVVWSAFSALRVYAVSGQKVYATVCVGLLAIVSTSIILFIVANIQFTKIPSASGSCSTGFKISQILMDNTIVSMAARACLIASEAMVWIVLLAYAPKIHNDSLSDISKSSVAATLRRTGLIYFAVMLLLNTLDAILFRMGIFYNVFPSFISPLSSIFMSRFFLDLRRASETSFDEETERILLLGSANVFE